MSIDIKKSNQILELKLARANKRNALNLEMILGLKSEFVKASLDSNIRVVLLSSVCDKAFCAGADLKLFSSDDSKEREKFVLELSKLFQIMLRFEKPIISAVNGVAVGAGFGLVLASDIVVASKDAKFGTPELKRGLFPFLILEMLKKHFMPKIVNELVLMGKILTAEKLKSLEFVNYLCKDKQGLEKLSLEKAEQIAGYNFEVTQLGKKLLIEDNRDKISNLEQALINNLNMLEVRENLKAFVK